MPVVPVIAPSPVTTDVNARAQTSALGGLATGVATGADALGGIGADIQMRENADYVMQGEITLRNAEREHRNDIESRKGIAAFGVTDESDKWWADTTQKISNDFQNDTQRELFNEVAQQRRQVSLDSTSGYEAAERRNSFNQSSASIIEGAIDSAAASPYNPGVIDLESRTIKETVADLAASNGWTTDTTDAELATQMTKMHAGVVSALMADSPLAAEAYFKEHRDEISGPERATMDTMITARVIDFTAQGLAESYYTDLDSVTDARKKVRAIKDPDLQKATRTAVNALFADEVSARNQWQKLASDGVHKLLSDDHSLQKVGIDPILWDSMSGQDQLAVEGYIAARDKAKVNMVTVDDFNKLREAEQMIEANLIRTPTDLEPFMPYLQETTRERLRKAAAENETVDLNELRKLFEARRGRKRDSTSSRTEWKAREWEDWALMQDYVHARVKAGAQGKDVAALADEFELEGYSAEDRWGFDPDRLIESLRADRTDFIFESPDQYTTMLGEVADQLGTTADQLYTKGGRDAIATLVKADKPVTAANIRYVLDQMNAN